MRSYGTEYHDPFEAKISQVVHAILAAPGVLPPLNINGISYAEASEWSNPIMEAMNEASHIWPKQLINFISIGTGIEDTQPPSKQQSSLTQVLFSQAKWNLPTPSYPNGHLSYLGYLKVFMRKSVRSGRCTHKKAGSI